MVTPTTPSDIQLTSAYTSRVEEELERLSQGQGSLEDTKAIILALTQKEILAYNCPCKGD